MNDTLGRRKFLKLSGVAGSALILGYSTGFKSKETLQKFTFEGLEATGLNDFIFIDQSGLVTLVNHRPEMGQGVYQAMPSLLAEELEVDMEDINIVQAKANEIKYDHQQVGGSSSVRLSWKPSRTMGAAAREMLIQAAANQWKVETSQCFAEKGRIYRKGSDMSFGYGELVEAASQLEIPKEPKLKQKKDFKILGKPKVRRDLPFKTNGEAVFGLDVEMDGMVYASVERCPTFVGKVSGFNKDEVMKQPGILDVRKSKMPVFSHVREGVAIIAEDHYSALKARKVLKVEWDESGIDLVSQDDIYARLKKASQGTAKWVEDSHGDFDKSFEEAEETLDLSYELPYQSHATMEPMNCVVQVKDGKCEFYGPIQSPNWIRSTLANNLELKEDDVNVKVSFLGGGFGRRAFTDFVLEAAFLSRDLEGKPVKTIWTREDDNTQGPFRPGTLSRMRAGFSKGSVTALEHNLNTQVMGLQWPGTDPEEKPQWVVEGVNTQYEVPNWRTNFSHVEFPIPVMWWRSVYASTNSFGHESFMDEVAIKLKKDPIAYRKELLSKSPRFVKVLDKVAKESGWNEGKTNKGVAIVKSFGSICAHVVEVARNNRGKLYVKKVTSVIDCGMTINNDTVKAQTEGNVVMALTAAFKSEITFTKGRANEQNFHQYEMLRIHETPDIEVHIMDNEEEPGGVGEPGLPPLAPALANAIFAESGKRIRKLPFDLNEV